MSKESVQENSKELLKKIKKDGYEFDLVIFIAKGSYYIGATIASEDNVELLEISATRKTTILKNIIKPVLRLIPKKMRIFLRNKEMKSTYHEKNEDRKVVFNTKIYEKYKQSKKIILIDDSIDSGNSIIEVKKALKNYFKGSVIKVAVFNTMKKSVIKPDYYLYEDTMINGPWSNDSKYHKKFLKEYEEWKHEYEKRES